MFPSRRDCLKMGLLAGVAPVAGCALVSRQIEHAEDQPGPPQIATTEEERILNRCGFGPSRHSIVDYRNLGKEAYLERELKGQTLEDPALLLQLQRLDAY